MPFECSICKKRVLDKHSYSHFRQHEQDRSRQENVQIVRPEKRKPSPLVHEQTNKRTTNPMNQLNNYGNTFDMYSDDLDFDFDDNTDVQDSVSDMVANLQVDHDTTVSHDKKVFTVANSETFPIEIDQKNMEIYKIFDEDNVGQTTIDKIVKWYNSQKLQGKLCTYIT